VPWHTIRNNLNAFSITIAGLGSNHLQEEIEMQKRMLIVLMGVFLFSTVFCGLASADNKEDAAALVKKGVEFIQQNGMEKAVEAFKTPEFKKGDLYLFCYDYKGVCLAHGTMPQLLGKNLWDMKTPTGQFMIREQVELAKKGGGWIDYQWMHETKKVLMDKTSYVMPVEGMEAYLACGFYKE
jgi:cytochrome c